MNKMTAVFECRRCGGNPRVRTHDKWTNSKDAPEEIVTISCEEDCPISVTGVGYNNTVIIWNTRQGSQKKGFALINYPFEDEGKKSIQVALRLRHKLTEQAMLFNDLMAQICPNVPMLPRDGVHYVTTEMLKEMLHGND